MATLTLDDFVQQLRGAYGPALRAVVLYGSAARAGTPPARGSYDLLVVVDALGLDALRRVAPAARAWAEAGNPQPLTLTTAEWRSSADIFPMEYADLLDRHRVLAGALPVDDVRVDVHDLRRQAEQQTLGTLLQLRGTILAAGNDAKRRLALVEASLSTMFVLFRTVARLQGVTPDADAAALAAWTGAAAGFDPAPFARAVRHVRGEARLAPADAEGVLAGYLDGLEQLVAHLDAFRPAEPPVG